MKNRNKADSVVGARRAVPLRDDLKKKIISRVKPTEVAQRHLRAVEHPGVAEAVREIIADVRKNGDRALVRLTKKFDRVALKNVRTPIRKPRFNATLRKDMELAWERILRYHREYADASGVTNDGEEGIWGRVVRPLGRVGIYVPAGSAPLFSTLLMAAGAARAAGVKEIAVVSPPPVVDAIHVAARIAGVTELYQVGGAQAIAALAYGTRSIRPVDKIVGPGNMYVAEAKRQVFGHVGIDSVAGPSEILIIADESASADVVAADMIAQAEHDVEAASILLTTSRRLADEVPARLAERLRNLPRRKIAAESLRRNGMIALCRNLAEMIAVSNEVAPEHLEIVIKSPWRAVDRITAAGAIFLGDSSPEVLGDYIAGPNHILPTGRTARFSPPLSARDFVAVSSIQSFSPAAARRLAGPAARLARAEQLEGHARSIESRLR
jgi:histidinol dehydrogenase